MLDQMDSTGKKLDTVALEVVTLELNDIPALGSILKHFGEMETDSDATEQPAFLEILHAAKGYVESLILKEKEDRYAENYIALFLCYRGFDFLWWPGLTIYGNTASRAFGGKHPRFLPGSPIIAPAP